MSRLGSPRKMMTVGSQSSFCPTHQEEEEEDKTPEFPPVPLPPDGGWGWVVVAASFFCNLIVDGIAYTFGVLLPALASHYQSDLTSTAWVGSLLCGVYMLSGPLVGGLVNKFGCRPVCMLGGVVSCSALLLSTLAPDVFSLALLYGVLGGLGFGLIYLPAIVSVGFYFQRRRSLATGISVCGSGVGAFVFAPLANFLLENYGWQTSNAVFGCICLVTVLCGAVMRPLQLVVEEELRLELPDGTRLTQAVPATPSAVALPKIIEDKACDIFDDIDINANNGKTKKKDKVIHRNMSLNIAPTSSLVNRNFSTPHLRPMRYREDSVMSSMSSTNNSLKISSLRIARPMSRVDVFYSGSIRNMNEDEVEQGELRQNTQSFISIGSVVLARNSLLEEVEVAVEEEEQSPVLAVLKTMLSPALLTNNKFLLIGVSNIFGFLGFYVPFVYLPMMAGGCEAVTAEQAALLLSIIGISNTAGRVLAGWLSDLPWVEPLTVVTTSLLLSAACLAAFPLLSTFPQFVTLGLLFGFFIAAYISLTSIVLVDLLGIENLTTGFGLLTMFRGAASVVGPPLAGAVFESTQNYSVSFWLAGGFLLAAGVTSALAGLARRRERAAAGL